MRNQGTGIPPALVWALGLGLLAVVTLASPQWTDLWAGIRTGQGPGALKGSMTFQGAWRLGGGLLLIFLLALWTQTSESGGVFSVTFLLLLWAFYLVTHGQAVAALLGKFTQAAG